MRKVNLEVIRKELYNNLSEMYFGAFYHMNTLLSTQYDECETNTFKTIKLSNCLEINRSNPFNDYVYSFYITVENNSINCYRSNADEKCFDWKWCVYYADVKNKTQLFMVVTKKLTMTLLNN